MPAKRARDPLGDREDNGDKRLKTEREGKSATPDYTPRTGKIEYQVRYPVMTAAGKKRLRKEKLAENERLVEIAEFQVSPFEANGAQKEGELDHHFAVTPHSSWKAMGKFSKFISEYRGY